LSISNHIKRDKLYIHYSLRFFFSPEVMHVEIENEKKNIFAPWTVETTQPTAWFDCT